MRGMELIECFVLTVSRIRILAIEAREDGWGHANNKDKVFRKCHVDKLQRQLAWAEQNRCPPQLLQVAREEIVHWEGVRSECQDARTQGSKRSKKDDG